MIIWIINAYLIFILKKKKDERQNSLISSELHSQPTKSFTESKQILVEWLSQIEKSLSSTDFQITFLPVLEEKLQSFQVIIKNTNTNKNSLFIQS